MKTLLTISLLSLSSISFANDFYKCKRAETVQISNLNVKIQKTMLEIQDSLNQRSPNTTALSVFYAVLVDDVAKSNEMMWKCFE